MKRNVLALVLASIFALVPLAAGLNAQATTSERATVVTPTDLDKQLNQLKSQVVEQRKLMNEQQRQHEKMIQQQREFANQQAVALANQKEVVAKQAATIDQQNGVVAQQTISLTTMQKVLYTAAGLVVLVSVLLLGFVFVFRKRTPNVEKQSTSTAILHIAPQANETPRVTELHVVQTNTSTPVDPDAATLRKLAQQFGVKEISFILTMPDQQKELPCRAIIDDDGKAPLVIFPGTSYKDPVAWDKRRQIARQLLAS